MRRRQLRLITLDGLRLSDPAADGSDLDKRKKKLALLAVIALSRRPPSKSALLEMFWGGEPEERARHSLSDALSHIRRVLGRDALEASGEYVALSEEIPLTIDAVEFDALCQAGQRANALTLYHAPFLDTFYIKDSRSFDDWADGMRARYARLYADAAEAHARERLENGDHAAAVQTCLQWLRIDAAADNAARVALESALSGPSELLVHTLDVVNAWASARSKDGEETDEDISALLARASAARREIVVVSETSEPIVAEPPRTPDLVITHVATHRGRRNALIGVALAASVAAVIFRLVGAFASAQVPVRANPAIAVMPFAVDSSDAQIAWLAEGIPQMIAGRLARATEADIVPLSAVSGAIARAGWNGSVAEHSQQIGVIVGATLTVDGSIERQPSGYTVHLGMRSPAGGPRFEANASGTDVVKIADEAAGRILSHIGLGTSGPALSDVETRSSDAYREYVLAERARDDGRYGEAAKHYEAAIATDSMFTAAIVALLHSDPVTYARIKPMFERVRGRLTDWDLLSERVYDALHGGEHALAERHATELVQRFPRDPRALLSQANVFYLHGKYAEAESSYIRLLALDSLALSAGDGPCAACAALDGLANLRVARRDAQGAIAIATRLTKLQPSAPSAWVTLGVALASAGDLNGALVQMRKAATVLGDSGFDARQARIAVELGDFAAAEHEARSALPTARREDAEDILVTSLRERGRWREADSILNEIRRRGNDGLVLLLAHALGESGDTSGARGLFRPLMVPLKRTTDVGQLAGDDARGAAWHRTLFIDARWTTLDTAVLRAYADSIGVTGARSYYARDWQMVHHVRGLLALRQGRLDDAERELSTALKPVRGFTRTNLELGRLRLRGGRPAAAVNVLRLALSDPLDAMGRYATHTEIQFELARAFAALRQGDSAHFYSERVRRAWADADPGFRLRLSQLAP